MVYIHIDVTYRLVCGQIEHRPAMPVQIGCGGSGQQLGQVVLHYTTVDTGDDDSYWIFVEDLEGSSLTFFMPLPLQNPS